MEFEKTKEAIYTVTEITREIKRAIENNLDFNNIWIKGEISNLTFHSSGHIYFTLKDENSVISAVFFKYANRKLKFRLEEGMSVFVYGSITLFEKRGSYQINVSTVKPEGIGELQKRIDQLKKKLSKEGIFDAEHKKDIPLLPGRIGIVTSPTGAALRDILKVALRRFPNMEIILAPAKVQGEGSPETIVKAIEELNKPEWNIDVIIAGRGGGSFEDLMAFNEEEVVMAFYNSKVPIISAVGHQIDNPLSDYAADVAAPTPSAAAEIAVPVKSDFLDEIDYLLIRCNNAVRNRIQELKSRVENIRNRRIFVNPAEMINYRELVLGDVENRLISIMKERISFMKNELLRVPDLTILIKNCLEKKKYNFAMALQLLDKLSPAGILKRGYAIAIGENKNIVKSVNSVKAGDNLNLYLYDGSINCRINLINKGDTIGKEKSIKFKT